MIPISIIDMALPNLKALTAILYLGFASIPVYIHSQEIDVDDLLNRLERIEKNISDIQKGKFDSLDKSLSSGYISRNEMRIDKIETNLRQNFGVLEEIQNQINIIDEKLDLINKDFQSRVLKLEKNLQVIEKNNAIKSENEQSVNYSNFPSNEKKIDKSKLTIPKKKMSEQEIKKKYENAIKLLWASKFEEVKLN